MRHTRNVSSLFANGKYAKRDTLLFEGKQSGDALEPGACKRQSGDASFNPLIGPSVAVAIGRIDGPK
jgi:hypothetical protein